MNLEELLESRNDVLIEELLKSVVMIVTRSCYPPRGTFRNLICQLYQNKSDVFFEIGGSSLKKLNNCELQITKIWNDQKF